MNLNTPNTAEMGLDQFTRAMINGKLQTFCEQRVAHNNARDHQVELKYAFRMASVILCERRSSPMDPKKWIRVKNARVDFDEDSKKAGRSGRTIGTTDRSGIRICLR